MTLLPGDVSTLGKYFWDPTSPPEGGGGLLLNSEISSPWQDSDIPRSTLPQEQGFQPQGIAWGSPRNYSSSLNCRDKLPRRKWQLQCVSGSTRYHKVQETKVLDFHYTPTELPFQAPPCKSTGSSKAGVATLGETQARKQSGRSIRWHRGPEGN